MFVIDNLTGGNLSFNGDAVMSLTPEDLVQSDEPVFKMSKELSCTLDLLDCDTDIINKIISVDDKFPEAYDMSYTSFVPARKNKNKRIQKKWIKKYGYRTIITTSKGWKINIDTDNNVTFVKER